MGVFWQNLRYGLRILAKSTGFALTAVLTLAIGIGANTAIFTVVNSIILRPLPFHDPGRLMIVSERDPKFEDASVAYQNFTDWRDQNSSFREMALFRQRDYTITGDRGPDHIEGREISAGFFTLLGVRPAVGRDIRPEEDQEGSAPVVLLSYGLWQRRFGGLDDVVGRTVHLNDRNYTVIGVAPKDFWFYSASDLFVPIGATGELWPQAREERQGARPAGPLEPGVRPTQPR